MLPSSFGVAAGHNYLDHTHSIAEVFITTDGGMHWQRRDPSAGVSSIRKAIQEGSLERFESLVVPTRRSFALAWSDPWLFDVPQSHVISTTDQGDSWILLFERNESLSDGRPKWSIADSKRWFLS